MPKQLTAKAVEKAKPDPSKRREIPDGLLPGLYLIVQPSGAKSWAVRYRHNGRPKKYTIGSVAAFDLGEARDEARKALKSVAKGIDPATERKQARAEAADERNLFKNVAADFLARHVRHNRSRPEVERMFRHDVTPHWGEKRIQDITRRDVIELMDRLTDRGVGVMANRVFSVVRKFFNWCIARDILDASPCAGLRPPIPEVSRDRVLSDDEVRWFWSACDRQGWPFGPLAQFLLLTGQRLSEVAGMTHRELNLDERLWTIPRERAKNDMVHEVPLSDAARGVIDRLPRVPSKAGYLFTTTGKTPVSGWSRAKQKLDKAMLEIAREEAIANGFDPEKVNIPDWRFHDLRRTAASGMARLGIAVHVTEAALNHKSGTIKGVAAVYNRYSYAEEKRQALEAWGRFVTSLVSGEPGDNVVPLKAAAHAES